MNVCPPPCPGHNTLGFGPPSGASAGQWESEERRVLAETVWMPPTEWGMWSENWQTWSGHWVNRT
jgi:hypothetical protein